MIFMPEVIDVQTHPPLAKKGPTFKGHYVKYKKRN